MEPTDDDATSALGTVLRKLVSAAIRSTLRPPDIYTLAELHDYQPPWNKVLALKSTAIYLH